MKDCLDFRPSQTIRWFEEGMSISQKHSSAKLSKKKKLFISTITCILENIVLFISMEFIHLSKNVYQFYPFCFSLTSGFIVLSAIYFFLFVLKRSTKLTTVPRIVLQNSNVLWNRMCMSFQQGLFTFKDLFLTFLQCFLLLYLFYVL
jgi:hypothetical protein